MTSQAILEQAGPKSNDVHAEKLELLLQTRLSGRVKDLHIDIRNGGVVLNGRTSTYHAKQLAQHAAMELSGLPILANDIEVT